MATTNKKWVYAFEEGSRRMRMLLGGKGANLSEMTGLGLPVPPGFTITTDACRDYMSNGGKLPTGLDREVFRNVRGLEKKLKRRFGNAKNPLLVSVRSGAPASMPGMMDTVLNLGLNDETVMGLISQTADERMAYDAYRRFIMMFADVVLGVERDHFESLLASLKKKEGVTEDTEMSVGALKECALRSMQLVRLHTGKAFPDDPKEQLLLAVEAVFRSWHNPRAISYRRMNSIPHEWGTGVNVQSMVFGNMGADSGTGVGFTRDPATGEPLFYSEYLVNAQGEDVVAGVRTPMDVSALGEQMPEVYKELLGYAEKLERHYRDMQDIEYTVEQGRLFVLQTRTGKRTGVAAIRIAADMVTEKLITPDEALLMVDAGSLEQLLHPQFDPEELAAAEGLAKGIAASPGAAAGQITFDADTAVAVAGEGKRVVLVRRMTSPDDIEGMDAAQGILTSEGGRTSHAAVVARAMGKTCVCGCSSLEIDYDKKQMRVNGTVLGEGDFISIDGAEGVVYGGDIGVVPSEIIRVEQGHLEPEQSDLYRYYSAFMSWADKRRKLGVRANADRPDEAALARKLGAEGIGLARTEHMFFDEDRLPHFQRMVLAKDVKDRTVAARKLLPFQRKDFYGLLKAMDSLPVIIRLLDPPLHEFLPHTDADVEDLSRELDISADQIRAEVERLHESNPMLGHRGCRLGVTFPEVYRMQARAIFEAACDLKKRGFNPVPEVMIPLVGHVNELVLTKSDVVDIAEQVMAKKGVCVEYLVGTMIELPRAALTAGKIGGVADFFSYGTNDLTQTAFGFSRDDVEAKFLPSYLEQVPGRDGTPILSSNPFEVLDREGVGELIRIGTERGRAVNRKLEVGICGEHGGEPNSVWFCHEIGLNYVSCSPFRVPIARLAAAQAALREKQATKPKSRKRSKSRLRSKA